MHIHPVFKILMLITLALSVQMFSYRALIVMLLVLAVLLLINKVKSIIRSIRKFKFFILVMLIVYGFNTPGVYIFNEYVMLNPTYEGLEQGILQTFRLLTMLAGIALLNTKTNRSELMSGFYVLFSPFAYLGINRSKLAARLWLTMQYVDHLDLSTQRNQGWVDRIQNALTFTSSEIKSTSEYVTIEVSEINMMQYVIFLLFILGMSMLVCGLR